MEKNRLVLNLGLVTCKARSFESNSETRTAASCCSSPAARGSTRRCGIGNRRLKENLQKLSTRATKEVIFKSTSSEIIITTEMSAESDNNTSRTEPMVSLNTSENNGTESDQYRNCPGDRCGAPPPADTARTRRPQQPRAPNVYGRCHKGLVDDHDARALMKCCLQSTMEQAQQMHIKGADCRKETPYDALRTDTFKKLLKCNRRRSGKARKPGRKTKWCRLKADECDGIELQLCPHLGQGHTHEKLLQEVTPLLLRTAQSLDCQLRELCRRLFFMKHNVPQMTAPALFNFHALLTTINRMLLADFASFPTGLKLPGGREC